MVIFCFSADRCARKASVWFWWVSVAHLPLSRALGRLGATSLVFVRWWRGGLPVQREFGTIMRHVTWPYRHFPNRTKPLNYEALRLQWPRRDSSSHRTGVGKKKWVSDELRRASKRVRTIISLINKADKVDTLPSLLGTINFRASVKYAGDQFPPPSKPTCFILDVFAA